MWTYYEHFRDSDLTKDWCFAFYWVMTTLTSVGYGDYVAQSMVEYRLVLLLEIAGVIVWSTVLFSMDKAFSISYDWRSYTR